MADLRFFIDDDTSAAMYECIEKWWDEAKSQQVPALGEIITYRITPTSLGTCIVVQNNLTKEEVDFTDYGSW